MQVIILNKHQQWPTQDNHNRYMILGVHSFTHFLLQFQHKKRIQIFLQGNISSISNNILWNQFFTAALLKDCYRFLAYQKGQQNSFMKINGRTFKMRDIMQWQNKNKIEQSLYRCNGFMIESFLNDGSIVTIKIDIGDKCYNHYDIVFVQNRPNEVHEIKSSSATKTKMKQNQTQSTHKKLKKFKNNTNQYQSEKKPSKKAQKHINRHFISSVPLQSLQNTQKIHKRLQQNSVKTFSKPQINQYHHLITQSASSSQDQLNNIQILTNKNQCRKNSTNLPNKRLSKNKFKIYEQTKQPIMYDSRCSSYNKSNAHTTNYKYKKQKIVEHLMMKKQEQLKSMKKQLEQREQYYTDKLQKQQQQHDKQFTQLNSEVKTILNKYKTKNKQIKKENQCLNEANGQMLFINKKLEQKCNNLTNQVEQKNMLLKQIQQNHSRTLQKLQNQQQKNINLLQKIEQIQQNYNKTLQQKHTDIQSYKTKYEQLLHNLQKMAISDHHKIGQSPKNRAICSDKQNLLF